MIGCDLLFGNDSNESGGNGSGGGGSSGGGTGSTRQNAISVTLGYSTSHTISSSGENWFKFVGTGNPVIFETIGNAVATTIIIYIGDNTYYDTYTSSGGEGSNALRSQSTTSGTTYFVRITARNSTSGTYTFAVKEPTSNLRTNPIIISVGNSSSHTINSNGTHWFRFTGDGNRVFFETSGNVVNTNINIYSGDSTSYIYNNWKSGVNFITISGQIYYISITGNSGTYTFNVRHGTGDGSSRFNAIEVTQGYSSSHTITSSGEHWFIYQGTGNPVTFKTTGNVVATTIIIYTGDNTYYDTYTSSGGEGSNALRTQSTTSGTNYIIRITARNSTYGTYNFIVE